MLFCILIVVLLLFFLQLGALSLFLGLLSAFLKMGLVLGTGACMAPVSAFPAAPLEAAMIKLSNLKDIRKLGTSKYIR